MLTVIGLSSFALAGLTACQSTQSKSAELKKEGQKTLKAAEKPLTIPKESKDVKVLDTTILTDQNGSAVVVDLQNNSDQTLTNVPILINVLDAKGKSAFTNSLPGIEPALNHVPLMKPHASMRWINDQVLATQKPKSVKVKVGETDTTFTGAQPDIEVSPPKLEVDSTSGIEATGTAVNKTGKPQDTLLLYCVATNGDTVVAAGRGAIQHFKAGTKPVHYAIFFIGDPKGAKLTLTTFPTLPTTAPTGGGT
jgi:hypothetical protein